MIESILNYSYMQNALFASLLGSIICGIVGTIIVEKKLVSMSGGIAHASFGGIGAGYFLGIEPIIGGLIFAVISSLGVGQIKRKTNAHQDMIVNIFWSGGMALGILFIALMPGYPPEMTSYLFGDILTVSDLYLYLMLALTFIVVFFVFSIFSYWKLYLFDEEYAKVLGIKTLFLETVLYTLISFSIVILIKVVGIILSIAMLTIPVAIAKLISNTLKYVMLLSGLIGIFFSLLGLTFSYYLNIPSGASIILVSITGYFASLVINKLYKIKAKEVS